jgi:mono/diheme cytochrome c family protein
MKLFKLIFVFAALSLFALACNNTNTNTANTGTQPSPAASTAATATPTPDEFAETREYYADNCATCHKEDGEGGQVKIDEKRIKVPSFKKGHALTHTDEEFAKQIANGGDGMPAYKEKMTPDEINRMVRYVRKEFQSGLVPATASGKPLTSEPPKH